MQFGRIATTKVPAAMTIHDHIRRMDGWSASSSKHVWWWRGRRGYSRPPMRRQMRIISSNHSGAVISISIRIQTRQIWYWCRIMNRGWHVPQVFRGRQKTAHFVVRIVVIFRMISTNLVRSRMVMMLTVMVVTHSCDGSVIDHLLLVLGALQNLLQ